MKRLLFIPLVLFVLSCEDKKEDTTPTSVELYEIEYQDTLMVFKWSICMDDDLFKYSLFSSDNESMVNKELLFESSNRIDTTFIQTITVPLFYYQMFVSPLPVYNPIEVVHYLTRDTQFPIVCDNLYIYQGCSLCLPENK